MLKRVLSSWNRSTAKNKSTDCVQSPPANAKPNVGCWFYFSKIKLFKSYEQEMFFLSVATTVLLGIVLILKFLNLKR